MACLPQNNMQGLWGSMWRFKLCPQSWGTQWAEVWWSLEGEPGGSATLTANQERQPPGDWPALSVEGQKAPRVSRGQEEGQADTDHWKKESEPQLGLHCWVGALCSCWPQPAVHARGRGRWSFLGEMKCGAVDYHRRLATLITKMKCQVRGLGAVLVHRGTVAFGGWTHRHPVRRYVSIFFFPVF